MDKKIILARLLAKALDVYQYDCDSVEEFYDSLWLMNGGIGSPEEEWETFNATFKEVFGVSYDEAKQIDLFEN